MKLFYFGAVALICPLPLFQIKMDPEMDSQFKIGFIGAGNMAYGIAKGILSGESKYC